MNLVMPDMGRVNGRISRHDFAALTTAPLMGPLVTTTLGIRYLGRAAGGIRGEAAGWISAASAGGIGGAGREERP